ncbi:MAG: hypothetical protein AVDCRST_MAG78-1457, partial [uncultured Rubrobacteraceae bacterium]
GHRPAKPRGRRVLLPDDHGTRDRQTARDRDLVRSRGSHPLHALWSPRPLRLGKEPLPQPRGHGTNRRGAPRRAGAHYRGRKGRRPGPPAPRRQVRTQAGKPNQLEARRSAGRRGSHHL